MLVRMNIAPHHHRLSTRDTGASCCKVGAERATLCASGIEHNRYTHMHFCVSHCNSRSFLIGTSRTTLLAGFGARLHILPKQTFAFAGFSGTVRTEALSSPGIKILSFSCSSFLRISLSVSNTFFAWFFSTLAPAATREIIVDIFKRCLSQNITRAIGSP